MIDEPTPDATPEPGDDFNDDFTLADLFSGSNAPTLNTAEGVGNLLDQTTDFIEGRERAQPGFITSPLGDAVPALLKPGGTVEYIDQTVFDRFSDAPRWRRGKAVMTSLVSFIDHLNRFGDADSAVFVRDSASNPGLVGVLDYNRKDTLGGEGEDERIHGEYRHGLHRVGFDFPVSDEWKAWTEANARAMSMTDFAHFLEDNVLDVAEIEDGIPESAERFVEMCGGRANIADWSTLTALAKSLSVYENAVVTEITDLHGGAINLTLAESHETEVAGIKASVPTMFFIAIPIFRDGAYYRLPVRLRYRKSRGGISFWYEMWRQDRAFKVAVDEAVNRVANETEAQVFYGSPEA